MNPDIVHLYGLLALRALADYDPIEFRRSTDLSKGEADKRIDLLVESVRDGEQHRIDDVISKRNDMRDIERQARSQTELSFLLKQLSSSCMQRAQQLALVYARSASSKPDFYGDDVRSEVSAQSFELRPADHGEEFSRLGVMRLLRYLPGYAPKFKYRIHAVEVDALLESQEHDESLPVVVVEAVLRVRSKERLRESLTRLRRSCEGWSNVVPVLLVGGISQTVSSIPDKIGNERLCLLVYSSKINEFVGQNAQAVLTEIQSRVLGD